MPKGAEYQELRLSPDDLRELHLALAVRVAQLASTNTGKMGPTAKAKLKRHLDACRVLDTTVQQARGKA